MKKQLLFIMPSLHAGGGEKSLVNLLSNLNYDRYDVDLFLFNHNGLFMKYVPKEVRILQLPKPYYLFSLPFRQSIMNLCFNKKFSLAINRICFSLVNRKKIGNSLKEQYSWKYLSDSLPILDKKYDVAIGFMEKTSTYFCIDKVKANKKIGWVHIDYDHLGMDPNFDKSYFHKLNHIVTVSKECASILVKRFPNLKQKITVIYNIVSPKLINKMASETEEVETLKSHRNIKVLSIGRLHYQKGFEMAIEACRKLIDAGYFVEWNIIGEGDERGKLEKLIQKNKIGNHIKLLGLKANPYPYIKDADLYVQPSRFEGKSIAIDEAKILKKPILTTNYPTVQDQISHKKNGMIVEMNASAIAEGIKLLLNNSDLCNKIVHNLSQEELGTEEEIKKLYEII